MKSIKKAGCSTIILLLVFVAIAGIYVAAQVLILPEESEVSTTLNQLYAQDQDTRVAGIENPVDIITFVTGDWIRVRKVRRMVAADLLKTDDDYTNAARILQHGENSTDFLQAQELSLKAFELGNEEMLRHSALAEDRYLISIGQPQKYGSQFSCDPPAGWQLSPVDPMVTDDERLQMDIEPLSIMEAKIAELNEVTDKQCSLTQKAMQQVEVIMDGPLNSLRE